MPPSFLHEALVQLLRSHPLLAVELLRGAMPSALPAFDSVVSDSADLGSELAPEAAADCVLRFEAGGRTVFVVVVEVQLSVDANKRFAWPAYLAGAHRRHRCDVALVVITPFEHVAAWARRPMRTGPLSGEVRAFVFGPKEVPKIEEVEEATRFPELAVVSALAHAYDGDWKRSVAIATAAVTASYASNDPAAHMYYDLILAVFSEQAKEALKMNLINYEYQDEGLRRAKAEGEARGKAEGEARGKAEGKAEGEAEGEARGQREASASALLTVLEARGFSVSPDLRRRIFGCTDLEQLGRWLRAAVTAESAEAALADPSGSPR
ncbi:MAG: hypothetical protein KA712_12155 [Myxococcales bacterium]|nr:hypothetical protein [Myxococcales bacterium]